MAAAHVCLGATLIRLGDYDRAIAAIGRAAAGRDIFEGPSIPVKLSETPGAVDRPAPLVGQHTDEILAELGYTGLARCALREQQII